MIYVNVDTRQAEVELTELVTTGSVGIQVQFTFNEAWDGLSRLAVFRSGDNPDWYDTVLTDDNLCVIPWELLTVENEGATLFIGAEGTNASGDIVIPTIWASAGAIKPGVHSGNASGADPTPTQWNQIRMLAESAAASAESAQESAETAETYAEHVPVVVDGYWAMWNGTEYVPTAQRAQGEPGTPGADGDDGVSPEVMIGSITGGHSVIITDRDHPDGQTFNVMDGDQGDTGPGVPAGGVPGQLLAKKTVDDYDGEWVDPTAELLSYDDTETYSSGTVGAEIGGLKNTLNSEVTTRENEFDNRVYNNVMKSAPSNANDVTLIGSTFAQDTACSNLPTSSGNYYFLMFFGQAQFAILYNYQGAKRTYCRYYTNGNWYPWMPIEGKPETGTPTFESGISGTVRVEKSGGVVIINGQITSTSAVAGNNGLLMTLPADFWPTESRTDRKAYMTYASTPGFYNLVVGTSGTVYTNIGSNTISANTPIQFISMSYII